MFLLFRRTSYGLHFCKVCNSKIENKVNEIRKLKTVLFDAYISMTRFIQHKYFIIYSEKTQKIYVKLSKYQKQMFSTLHILTFISRIFYHSVMRLHCASKTIKNSLFLFYIRLRFHLDLGIKFQH